MEPQSSVQLSVGLQVAAAMTLTLLLPAFQLLMSYLYFRYGHPWKRKVATLKFEIFLGILKSLEILCKINTDVLAYSDTPGNGQKLSL